VRHRALEGDDEAPILPNFGPAAARPGAKPRTRLYVVTQFVSHVFPPSAENACSERHVSVPGKRRSRTRIARSLKVSGP
jgi:hypothetical protein